MKENKEHLKEGFKKKLCGGVYKRKKSKVKWKKL